VPHFYSPILKLLTRHDDNTYWCRPTWRGDDRLGLPHHTSAIRMKSENHWRFLCRTCELVQTVRATNISVTSVCGSTDISGNTQHVDTALRVWTFFRLDSWPRHRPFWQEFVVCFSSPSNTEQFLNYATTAFFQILSISPFNLPSTLRTARKYSTISYILKSFSYHECIMCFCRSQWQRNQRRVSAAARLLELSVRIPPKAWISVMNLGNCPTWRTNSFQYIYL